MERAMEVSRQKLEIYPEQEIIASIQESLGLVNLTLLGR